jgi:hypothetical protein
MGKAWVERRIVPVDINRLDVGGRVVGGQNDQAPAVRGEHNGPDVLADEELIEEVGARTGRPKAAAERLDPDVVEVRALDGRRNDAIGHLDRGDGAFRQVRGAASADAVGDGGKQGSWQGHRAGGKRSR